MNVPNNTLPAQRTDIRIAEIVVWFIGIDTTIGVVGLIVLAFLGRDANAALYTLVGGLTGGLIAILVQARGGQRQADNPSAEAIGAAVSDASQLQPFKTNDGAASAPDG